MQAFQELFSLTSVEEQFSQFCEAESSHPGCFAQMLKNKAKTELIARLLAFIDVFFDEDFLRTIDALIPYSATLIQTCNFILSQYSKAFSANPFLFRTTVLLLGGIYGDPRTRVENYFVFSQTINTILQTEKLSHRSIPLEGLKRALKSSPFRLAFCELNGFTSLSSIVEASFAQNNFDTLYHSLFCIWAVSFCPLASKFLSDFAFVSLLVKLFSNVQPEKESIVQLLFNITQQLISLNEFVEQSYDFDLLRFLLTFKGKHYVDEELSGFINQVCTDLSQTLKQLSLWDRYLREVNSGKLKNTLNHRSEAFWKLNIERFGENNFAVLVNLRHLLQSEDEETVSVALHDVGEYVNRHPLGKKKIEEIGAKEIILKHLVHKNPAVQREALRTTQHLLLKSI